MYSKVATQHGAKLRNFPQAMPLDPINLEPASLFEMEPLSLAFHEGAWRTFSRARCRDQHPCGARPQKFRLHL